MGMEGKPIGTPVSGVPLVGNNTIIINNATMKKIVEDYLHTHVFKDGVGVMVRSITQATRHNAHQTRTFTIEIGERP